MHSTQEISGSGVFDRLMRPWGDKTLSPCKRTAYVIASLAIGILTVFIFHIVYNIAYYLFLSESQPSFPLLNSTPQVQEEQGLMEEEISQKKQLNSINQEDISFSQLVPLPEPEKPHLNPGSSNPSGTQELRKKKPPLSSSNFKLSNPTSRNNPFVNRSSRKPIPLDNRIERLHWQRIAQEKIICAPDSPIPPLSVLAARLLIYCPEIIPKSTLPVATSEIFWMNTLPTFLSDSSLSQKNVEKAMTKWHQIDRDELEEQEVQIVYLSGCTHLRIATDFLPHTLFTKVNLNGVKLENPDAFTSLLCNQTHLTELVLDYEQFISQNVFCDLLRNCQNLTTLQIGVIALDSRFPPFESSLHYLRIAIPTLTESGLRSLLFANPRLEEIILHIKLVSSQLNVSACLRKAVLNSLNSISIVVDTQSDRYEHFLEKKLILFTYTDSTTLFHDHKPARTTNFQQESFFQLLNRYKHDASRFNLIIRKLVMDLSCNKLEIFGMMFADRLTIFELKVLFRLLEPFSLQGPSEAASYNLNLEIFLRAGVDFCGRKSREVCDFWDEKRTLILQFLQKHNETFQLSQWQIEFT